MTSYAALLQNTLKFSLAPSTLAIYTSKFGLKRREKQKIFASASVARKNGRFLGVGGFAPPQEEFLPAPMTLPVAYWLLTTRLSCHTSDLGVAEACAAVAVFGVSVR